MTTYYVDPAAGGSNDGTDWTNAWTSLQSAADTAVAGDIVYCRGTETLSAAIDFDTNDGTAAGGFIKFLGCNASGNVDGTRYVLDGDSSAAACVVPGGVDFVWLENFELTGSTGAGFGPATANTKDWVLVNVYSHSNSGHGFDYYNMASLASVFAIRCQAINNGNRGAARMDGARFLFCSFSDNADAGLINTEYCMFIGCIVHNNGSDGVECDAPCWLVNCVIDENDDNGIAAGVGDLLLSIGCRITDNGKDTSGYGINVTSGRVVCGWNFFDGNDSGTTNGNVDVIPYDSDTDTNETSGTEGYTDGASDDFNLTSEATLRSVAIELD